MGEQQRWSQVKAQGAVELVGEFDDFSGEAARRRQRRELKDFAGPRDGVVGGDDALIAKAEATVEIEAAGERTEVGDGSGGWNGEAAFEVGQESLEHAIGVFQSANLGEAKFADEAVLEGAPEAFDAAFGLGRVGGDLLDAEFFQGATDVSGELMTGEFFGDGPVGIVALEDTVAIAIEAEGDAVGGDYGVQAAEVADGVFGFELKAGGGDTAGGVVGEAEQSEQGPRPWSQSWRLPSPCSIMPKRGRRGRRAR